MRAHPGDSGQRARPLMAAGVLIAFLITSVQAIGSNETVAPSPGFTHVVQNGETLSQIAREVSGEPGYSPGVYVWMVAIYRANPLAFQGNLNALRLGARLRIPEISDVTAIAPADAEAEVRWQTEAWRTTWIVAHSASATEPGRLHLVTPSEGTSLGARADETRTLQQQVEDLSFRLTKSKREIELRDADIARVSAQLVRVQAAPASIRATAPKAENPGLSSAIQHIWQSWFGGHPGVVVAPPPPLPSGSATSASTAPPGPGKPARDTGVSLSKPRSAPIWNVWLEPFSTVPNFAPLQEARKQSEYSLEVDLAAIALSAVARGVLSRDSSQAFQDWFARYPDLQSKDVEIIVIPDRRFFEWPDYTEHVKSFNVDLAKIRAAQTQGLSIPADPLGFLRSQRGEAPFLYGRKQFHLRTTAATGLASVALSVWADGRPIDEISFSICIKAATADRCVEKPHGSDFFDGVDLTGRGEVPDAALHLIDRQSDVVGVFRCNVCKWAPGAYKIWRVDMPAADFERTVVSVLSMIGAPFDPDDKTSKWSRVMDDAGDTLFQLVFPTRDNQDAQAAGEALAGFTRSTGKSPHGSRRTLFVRLLPGSPDLILTPLNLMRVPSAHGEPKYLGNLVSVEAPLELQDYEPSSSCLTDWTLFVPPEPPTPIPLGLQAVNDARDQIKSWLDSFQSACPTCFEHSESDFTHWLQTGQKSDANTALLILSHHENHVLSFWDGGTPAVPPVISRHFGPNSVAVIAACGSAKPGASEFMRSLNAGGVYSIVATSTSVDPVMAGQFVRLLFMNLKQHGPTAPVSLNEAQFAAVTALEKLAPKDGPPWGARALEFLLAGNGAAHLCMPAGVDGSVPIGGTNH